MAHPGRLRPGPRPSGRVGQRRPALATVAALLLLALPASAQAPDPDPPPIRLVRAARALVGVPCQYDGSYRSLAYPGGDPGGSIGVCSDLVVRAYRGIGLDLQVLVHEDMKKHFAAYPARKLYDQARPDPNIDHRRVPNLMTFFARHGQSLTLSLEPEQFDQWLPGDVVVFDLLDNGIPSHVGIVSDRQADSGLPLVLHHFPPSPSEQDCLRTWKIAGHFRYFPKKPTNH